MRGSGRRKRGPDYSPCIGRLCVFVRCCLFGQLGAVARREISCCVIIQVKVRSKQPGKVSVLSMACQASVEHKEATRLQGIRLRYNSNTTAPKVTKSERERGGVHVCFEECLVLRWVLPPFDCKPKILKGESQRRNPQNITRICILFFPFIHYNSSFSSLSSPISSPLPSNHAARAAATTAGTSTHTTSSNPFAGTCPANGR